MYALEVLKEEQHKSVDLSSTRTKTLLNHSRLLFWQVSDKNASFLVCIWARKLCASHTVLNIERKPIFNGLVSAFKKDSGV